MHKLTKVAARVPSGHPNSKSHKGFALLLIFLLPLLASCATPAPKTQNPAPITHSLSFPSPTPGWTLTPVAAYRAADEHWCIHQLTPPDGMVMQMISEVGGSISFTDPDATGETPVRHYVLGKTWAWGDDSEITFIDSLEKLNEQLKNSVNLDLLQTTPADKP